MVKALKLLPVEEKDRVSFLKALFDVTDEDRGEKVFLDFFKIKNMNKQCKYSQRIANRVEAINEKS